MRKMLWITFNLLTFGLPALTRWVLGSGSDSKNEDDLLRKRRCSLTLNPFSGMGYDDYMKLSEAIWPNDKERSTHIDRWLTIGDRAKSLWVSDRQWGLIQDYGDVFNIHTESGLYDPSDWVIWTNTRGYVYASVVGYCPACDNYQQVTDYGECSHCGTDGLTREFSFSSRNPDTLITTDMDQANEIVRQTSKRRTYRD